MIPVYEVERKFDIFIKLSDITDEHKVLRNAIHQEVNRHIASMNYIHHQGSFGIVVSLENSEYEWMDSLKELLPLSTSVRYSTIAIMMD